MDADSIRGITVGVAPANPFTPQPSPSGDTCNDMGLYLDPLTNTLNWKKTNFACGPSALASNIGLVGNCENFLVTAPGIDGMRGGMAAYIPPGVWNIYGSVLIAAKTSIEYVVKVWQGHALDPARPGIVGLSPAIVGGGCNTWAGGMDRVCEVGFRAHMIQFTGDDSQANEIVVSVYPKMSGDAGAALATIQADSSGGGNLPSNFASSLMIYRVRGK